jgi:hypothetical protein
MASGQITPDTHRGHCPTLGPPTPTPSATHDGDNREACIVHGAWGLTCVAAGPHKDGWHQCGTCSGAASLQTPASTGAGSFRGGASSAGLSPTAPHTAPAACQHALEVRRGNSPHRRRHMAAGGREDGWRAENVDDDGGDAGADCAAGWASVQAAAGDTMGAHNIGRHGINPHGGAADLHGCHNSSTTKTAVTARTLKA